jgi:putative ABC transport system permease protein
MVAAMYSNYLKIAWRNITGSPLFSAINVIGLSIGLACCIIITLFVRYELSYDRHWEDADRIYRVTRDFFGNDLQLSAVAPPIAPLLKEDFSEIEAITRLLSPGQITLTYDDETYREENLAIADPNVFDVFDLRFIDGDPATALAKPTNLVMTQRAAERYFGNDNPIGKTMQLMGQMQITVSAVIEDLPDNTHMAFDMLGSLDAVPLMLAKTSIIMVRM